MAANSATTPVSVSKSGAMSRVLDLVPKGYHRAVAGQCPAHKVLALARKFHLKYGIGCSPAQRLLRKRDKLANACLVLFWPGHGQADADPEAKVDWLLLVTEGIGTVNDEESLMDLRQGKSRLQWLGYELLRLPKRDGTAWTWRRPKAAMQEWHALLESAFTFRRYHQIPEILTCLARQPGFAGVRSQTQALFQYAYQQGYRKPLPPIFTMHKVAQGERIVVG